MFALPAGQVVAPVRDGVWDAYGVRYGSPDPTAGPHALCVAPEVAQSEPSVFPQAPGLLDPLLGPALGDLPQSPDSFTLRIQGPSDVAPGDALPVLFFVHGGGFTTGSGEVRWYDAAQLVRRGRFLLVTANYRLGAASGLLGGESDNVRTPGGLAWQDLLAAARWVRAHIASFGGDPDDVSVGGDSAGAWFAHALSTSETTRGWFARTLLVSMPRMAPLSATDDAARRTSLAAALEAHQEGAERPSYDAVLAAQRQVSATYSGRGFPFAPAQDSALPAWLGEPGESGAHLHTSELLLVTTRSEASAFLRHLPESTFTSSWVDNFVATHFADTEQVRDALAGRTGYEAAVALLTWWQFASLAHDLADSATTEAGASVRVLRLDLPSPLPRALVPHCFPLPFLFGERASWHDAPMLSGIEDDTFDQTRQPLQAALLGLVHGSSSPVPVWDPAAPRFLRVLGDAAAPQDARRLKVEEP
ncbi:carboxylesterase family protein [Nocardioides gilvus]|uniref:carboxylesterase family protein n=1 Tax=Nocardioides gilvus TaxID=1735589 RepID=UPI0013A53A01|nr:carboxylesterase family protein [Nocardioides gilvus]